MGFFLLVAVGVFSAVAGFEAGFIAGKEAQKVEDEIFSAVGARPQRTSASVVDVVVNIVNEAVEDGRLDHQTGERIKRQAWV